MKLIIGLGNPGAKYSHTRHNLGQNIVINFCANNSIDLKNQSKFNAQIGEFQKNILAIPTEYMNNSGLTVQKIAHYYKIEPKDIYIIHDDLDIEIGDYKVQFDRGAAGHNGIKSTIEQLGTQAFNRIRVGIGKPQNNIPVEDYVLQLFSSTEKPIIDQTIKKIISHINEIL